MSTIPSNDVFRMMSVRGPQTVSDPYLNNNFSTYAFVNAISAATLTTVDNDETRLYTTMLSLANLNSARSVLEAQVTTYREESSYYYQSVALLDSVYPAYAALADYFQSNITTDDYATAIVQIESILGGDLGPYVAATQFADERLRFWDNLISAAVIADLPEVRERIMTFIRIAAILEKADALSGTAATDAMRKIWKSKVVLPAVIFPLPLVSNDLPANTEVAVDNTEHEADLSNLEADIDKHEAALLELLKTIRQQELDQGDAIYTMPSFLSDEETVEPGETLVEDVSQIKPDKLTSSYYEALSADTKQVITDAGFTSTTYSLPHILKAIEEKLMALGRQAVQHVEHTTLVQVGNTLMEVSELCTLQVDKDPCNMNNTVDIPEGYGDIKPLGVGDLLVIRQHLLKYEMGEIAHVENVLASENYSRTHRRLNKTEETIVSETERISDTERDTQTTERHSLEKEMSEVSQQDSQQQAGVSAGASYGPVSVSANISSATSSSAAQANSTATEYAKEITERAAERVREKVREQRSVTTTKEIEETAIHGYDNTAGTTHIIGIYHWLDKYYLNQLVNYGRRLMFEFVIPEPAAFYIYSKANNKAENALLKPIAPEADNNPLGQLLSHEDIHAGNYAKWAALYSANAVAPPPEVVKHVTAGYNYDAVAGVDYPTASHEVEIPDGYMANSVKVLTGLSHSAAGATSPKYVRVFTGKQYMIWYHTGTQDGYLGNVRGKLPISIQAFGTYYIINVEITCLRTPGAYKQWQIDTYNAIIQSYKAMKYEYDAQLNFRLSSRNRNVQGFNPERNREIEREELKKGAIELLTNQRFDAFDAMRNNVPSRGYPEFDQDEALAEGDYIRFFEQSFEWTRINYFFYPYFWGRKPNWTTVKQFEDHDPTFRSFLQSGAARVLVPVRLGHEEAVLNYLASGEIWNGGDVPTIDDPLYLSIIDEIRDMQENADGVDVGEHWITKVPTSLVMLQPDIPPVLPDNSTDLGVV